MFSWLLLQLVLIYKWFVSELAKPKYDSIVAHRLDLNPTPLFPTECAASSIVYKEVGIIVSSTVYGGTIIKSHLQFNNQSHLLITKCKAFLVLLESCANTGRELIKGPLNTVAKTLMKDHMYEDLEEFKRFITIPENRITCVNWLVCYFLNPKNIKDLNSLLDTSELKKQFLEDIGAFVRVSSVLNITLMGSPNGADYDVFLQIDPKKIQNGYTPIVHPDDVPLLLNISSIDGTKPLSCTYYCSDGVSVTHTSCGHPFVVQWLLSLPTTGTTTPIFSPFTAPQLVALIAIRIEHIVEVLQKKDITRSTDLKGHPILKNDVYINKLVKLLIHAFLLIQGVQVATKEEHYVHFRKFQDRLGAKDTSGTKDTSETKCTSDLLPALEWVLSHHEKGIPNVQSTMMPCVYDAKFVRYLEQLNAMKEASTGVFINTTPDQPTNKDHRLLFSLRDGQMYYAAAKALVPTLNKAWQLLQLTQTKAEKSGKKEILYIHKQTDELCFRADGEASDEYERCSKSHSLYLSSFRGIVSLYGKTTNDNWDTMREVLLQEVIEKGKTYKSVFNDDICPFPVDLSVLRNEITNLDGYDVHKAGCIYSNDDDRVISGPPKLIYHIDPTGMMVARRLSNTVLQSLGAKVDASLIVLVPVIMVDGVMHIVDGDQVPSTGVKLVPAWYRHYIVRDGIEIDVFIRDGVPCIKVVTDGKISIEPVGPGEEIHHKLELTVPPSIIERYIIMCKTGKLVTEEQIAFRKMLAPEWYPYTSEIHNAKLWDLFHWILRHLSDLLIDMDVAIKCAPTGKLRNTLVELKKRRDDLFELFKSDPNASTVKLMSLMQNVFELELHTTKVIDSLVIPVCSDEELASLKRKLPNMKWNQLTFGKGMLLRMFQCLLGTERLVTGEHMEYRKRELAQHCLPILRQMGMTEYNDEELLGKMYNLLFRNFSIHGSINTEPECAAFYATFVMTILPQLVQLIVPDASMEAILAVEPMPEFEDTPLPAPPAPVPASVSAPNAMDDLETWIQECLEINQLLTREILVKFASDLKSYPKIMPLINGDTQLDDLNRHPNVVRYFKELYFKVLCDGNEGDVSIGQFYNMIKNPNFASELKRIDTSKNRVFAFIAIVLANLPFPPSHYKYMSAIAELPHMKAPDSLDVPTGDATTDISGIDTSNILIGILKGLGSRCSALLRVYMLSGTKGVIILVREAPSMLTRLWNLFVKEPEQCTIIVGEFTFTVMYHDTIKPSSVTGMRRLPVVVRCDADQLLENFTRELALAPVPEPLHVPVPESAPAHVSMDKVCSTLLEYLTNQCIMRIVTTITLHGSRALGRIDGIYDPNQDYDFIIVVSVWSSRYDKGLKIDIDGIKFDITFVSDTMDSKELLLMHYVVSPISARTFHIYIRESYTFPPLSIPEVYKLLHPMYCIMANKNSTNPALTVAILFQTIAMYTNLLKLRVGMCKCVRPHVKILSAEYDLDSIDFLTRRECLDFSFMTKREFTKRYDIISAKQMLALFNEPLFNSHGNLCMTKYKANTAIITGSMMSCMPVELRELFELVIELSDAKTPSTAKSMKNVIDTGIA